MQRGKLAQQIRAKKLRTQGRSVKEIARLLKVSKSSASVWVRNVYLRPQQRERLKQRELRGGVRGRRGLAVYWKTYRQLHPKAVSKGPRWPQRSVDQFFDVWTPEMAYLLGYFSADGCMYRNKRGSCYVGFVSTDAELIQTVKHLMGVTNAIEEYQSPKPHHMRRYTLQVGSRKLYERLLQLGFTPRKSLTVRFPAVPDEVLAHFVRGNLDGDGCVYVGKYLRKNGRDQLAFSARFTCGTYEFLKVMQERLNRLTGIGLGSIHKHGTVWNLGYSAHAARQLYQFLYPTTTVPCLMRKRNKFIQGIAQMVEGPVV